MPHPPGQLLLQLLHGPVALGVVLDLGLDVVVQVLQVVRLYGGEAFHQQLGDLNLLVVLGLRHSEVGLRLTGKKIVVRIPSWIACRQS